MPFIFFVLGFGQRAVFGNEILSNKGGETMMFVGCFEDSLKVRDGGASCGPVCFLQEEDADIVI